MAAPFLPPSPASLTLEAVTAQAGVILLKARTLAQSVACPACGHLARRVHSRYRRRLLDLPWQGQCVRIELTVRKLFCDNHDCPRRIFTEPLPGIAARYAHKTLRLGDALRELVLLAGGEAAARIARTFGLMVSPDALLEAIHRQAIPAAPTPRVLGIDDFAFRKGRRYGTILVDQERRCPIDLLPDREASSVAQWLKTHPGVQIVTRDRAEAYRNGITAGAPEALQVADRFHLLANLTQALQESLTPHRKHFRRTADMASTQRTSITSGCRTALQKLQAQRRDRRREKWQRVQELSQQGYTHAQITFETGVSLRTVTRFLSSDVYPERRARARSPNELTPFLPYIKQHGKAGGQNVAQLYRQIQEQGFTGSYGAVYTAVVRLRKGMSLMSSENGTARVPALRTHYSARQMTWLVLQRTTGKLTPEEQADLSAALEAVPDLSEVVDLVERFVALVRRRDSAELERWLATASASSFGAVKGLARSLGSDLAAVRASLEHEWSNGPVEGQVNRLKFLKRQMYGAGSFDLLKARVLHRSAV